MSYTGMCTYNKLKCGIKIEFREGVGKESRNMNYYFIKRTEKKEGKPIPWLQERHVSSAGRKKHTRSPFEMERSWRTYRGYFGG